MITTNLPALNGCNTVLLFLKPPVAGKTKTRLIPALGAEGAAELSFRMASHVIDTLTKVPSSIAAPIVFVSSTEGMETVKAMVNDRFPLALQRGNSLGERLRNAFQCCFINGARSVVVIGSDCVELTSATLVSALESLRTHDVVIGPSVDGGYYLIGMNTLYTELFSNISWSSSETLSQTLAKARALSLRVAQLEAHRDIDTPEDLRYLSQEFLPNSV